MNVGGIQSDFGCHQGWTASLISFFSWWNKENGVLIFPILVLRHRYVYLCRIGRHGCVEQCDGDGGKRELGVHGRHQRPGRWHDVYPDRGHQLHTSWIESGPIAGDAVLGKGVIVGDGAMIRKILEITYNVFTKRSTSQRRTTQTP
jgi:hypothetical protein